MTQITIILLCYRHVVSIYYVGDRSFAVNLCRRDLSYRGMSNIFLQVLLADIGQNRCVQRRVGHFERKF